MVSWTNESYIRVFAVGNEVKQTGTSRRFENSKALMGAIKLCTLNANGKKIGIISNKISNSSSVANSCFHIYDLDSDSFVVYNLGGEKVPTLFHWDKKDFRYFGVQIESLKPEAKPEDTQKKN